MFIRFVLTVLAMLAAPAALAQRTAGMIDAAPGVQLAYQKIGSGPEVVIVPGGFLYEGAVEALATPGRTLILYDMRNRGGSNAITDPALVTLEADVADLEAVRRHAGAEKVRLIGWSYLGLMTALYAVEHPGRVERLVQIGPVAMKWDAPQPQDLVWRDPAPVIPAALDAELEKLRADRFHETHPQEYCVKEQAVSNLRLVGDPANAAKLDPVARCAMRNEWPVNFQRHLGWHFVGSVQKFEPPRAKFAALAIPVLTIHGTWDRNASFAGGAEWATTFPDGRLVIIPRAAHSPWLDDAALWQDVDRFLTGAWPARAHRVRSIDAVRKLTQGKL
jgi:proline iminopeptidase